MKIARHNATSRSEERINGKGAEMMSMEKIKMINARLEQMALDYDIPYPTGGELRGWQTEIMNRN